MDCPPSSTHPAHSHRVHSREDVDVELLAQRGSYYLKIQAEEAQILAADPTARDRAYAKFQANANLKPDVGPFTLVPPGEDPDEYLAAVDAKLQETPVTFEDRIFRIHAAAAALTVLTSFKVKPVLPGHQQGASEPMDELLTRWAHDDSVDSFGLGMASGDPLASQSQPPPPPHPPSSSPSTRLSSIEVEEYIKNPTAIFGKKFVFLVGELEEGQWEVESVLQQADGVLFHVLFEDCGDDFIPHDVNSMRSLLQDSRLVA